MLNEKQFKQRQALAWGSTAKAYDRYFSTVGHPAEMQMLHELKPKAGEIMLDVACGTGSFSFLTAPMVGDSGRVVGIDLAPQMIEIASEKARTRGTSNVSFEVMDAEQQTFKTGVFDLAVCKWGLTLFPDYHRALKETFRVLKPGGRFAALVFGRPEASYFVTVAARAAFKLMPSLVTHQATGPTDFQFGADGAIEAAFNAADFANVRSRRFTLMITCSDGAKYWDLFTSGFGNFGHKLGQAERSIREAVRRGVIESVERYQSRDGIRLPLEVVLCCAEKPRKDREKSTASCLRSLDALIAEETSTVREIAPDEVAAIARDDGVVVLDVRSPESHSASHIPRARSAPRARLEAVAEQLIDLRSTRRIIVYSEDGKMGHLAAQTLSEMGYENVTNMRGGFDAWVGAKLPVETGSRPTPGLFGAR